MATMQRGYTRHPKIAALSDAAFRLWAGGNDYSDSLLTDGIILKTALQDRSIAAKSSPKLLAELTRILPPYRVGLWEDQGDHYLIHDYLDWNDSREVIQASRARSRERAARWRERHSGDNGDGDGVTHGVTNGARNGARNGVTNGAREGGSADGIRDRDRDRSTDLPPTPLAGGLTGTASTRLPTRAERKRAEEFRRKVWGGCRHEPKCASFDACLAAIVQGWRDDAANDPPLDDETPAEVPA